MNIMLFNLLNFLYNLWRIIYNLTLIQMVNISASLVTRSILGQRVYAATCVESVGRNLHSRVPFVLSSSNISSLCSATSATHTTQHFPWIASKLQNKFCKIFIFLYLYFIKMYVMSLLIKIFGIFCCFVCTPITILGFSNILIVSDKAAV